MPTYRIVCVDAGQLLDSLTRLSCSLTVGIIIVAMSILLSICAEVGL